MSRLICTLLLSLMTCAVLAAPPAKDSWEKPIDPDDDCLIDIRDNKVTMELPGGDHELPPVRNRSNAPRLLREVEGDFVMQVRIHASFRPSAKSSVEGEDPRVAAGLVLISPDKKNYVRLEYAVSRRNGKLRSGFTEREGGPQLGVTGYFIGWNPTEWAPNEDHIYLCIEREGNWIRYVLSSDGKKWERYHSFSNGNLPAKFKAGLAAYSTSTEPFKVRFDQFKLSKGEEKSK